MKKVSKKILTLLLAAVMVMGMGTAAFAVETTANYTSAVIYYEGEPAPHGMDTGCFESVSTNANGDTVIELKTYTYLIATGTIEACTLVENESVDFVDGETLVIPASYGSSVDVKITFGGSLATLIKLGVVPMSNPMTCTIVLS